MRAQSQMTRDGRDDSQQLLADIDGGVKDLADLMR